MNIKELYMWRTLAGISVEHETPPHEFSGGKHGSPLQSEGVLINALAKSSIAATMYYRTNK